MDLAFSSNADRLEYLYLNLVGQVVRVRMTDGACVEGIFVSRTDVDAETEAGILLCCTRFTVSEKHQPLDPANAEFTEDMIIPYRCIFMVDAINTKLRMEAPGRTDVRVGDFSMKKFDWANDGTDELLESESHQPGAWDQFAVNEKNFGVKTSYKEEFYTTHLNHNNISDEQRAQADRLAREIEKSGTRGMAHYMDRVDVMKGDEGLDEGALYSDVQRPVEGEKKRAYVPPTAASRKAAELQPAATAAPIEDGANRNKRQDDERAALQHQQQHVHPQHPHHQHHHQPQLQHESRPKSPQFNPKAAPYTPPKPSGAAAPVLDFLSALATVITSNEQCYACPEEWPGTGANANTFYDQDDSTYSQRHVYEVQPNMQQSMQPPMPQPPPQGMYPNQQNVPNPHRNYYQNRPQMPPPQHINQMHQQNFHQHHQHHHHQQPQQPPQQTMQQPYYYNMNQGNHQNNAIPEYNSPKGVGPSMPRNPTRPQKSAASRVEPQQPVSTAPAVPPVPVPTVDSSPAPEIKHGPKLQRGRGGAAMQRNDEGAQGADTNTGGNTGPKKRGGK